MAFDMFEVDGVNPLSAPVFAADCYFPITNWLKYMPPDDVMANMPIRIGNWANNTKAPQLITESYAVVTSGVTGDNCNYPTVSADMTSCDWQVPNMVEIGLQSDTLNIMEMTDDFCQRRRVNPDSMLIFDRSGGFDPGQPFAMDFLGFVMKTIVNAHSKMVYHSALVGDDANTFQFEGLYTQLAGGWANASGSPGNCDSNLNTEAVIDWGAMVGQPTGAPPDAKTADGATVTIWGQTFDVEAGLTLPEVLDRYWFAKVEHDWTANRGSVTQWELHMPHGQWGCAARAAACIQPCAPNEVVAYINDADLRDRYVRMAADKAITLFPSQRRLPVFESNLIAANTWRLGPRTIGGIPTYGLFFDSMDRYFGNLVGVTIDGGYGYPPGQGAIPPITAPDLRNQIEDRAIHWDMYRTTPKCFIASVMLRGGLLVAARHLWLRIENVTCTNWLESRTLNLTVDGTAIEST